MKTAPTADELSRRKRLGQFFSGDRLASLLAVLAQASEAQTIIDPMVGSGDMLAACVSLGAQPTSLIGIEIDPLAADLCQIRLESDSPSFSLVEGNAFDPSSWDNLPSAFDLVITNPPYVRYQLGSNTTGDIVEIPGANDIRSSLVSCLERAKNLCPEDRRVFADCARQYSGLADLAVPSWILCCARVAIGGRLAVVVPNTWLTRDYAMPVLYILRRFFEIEYVVEDTSATWFPEALTRTTLVVAKRVNDKGSPYTPGGHLHISIPAQFADNRSLVGALFQDTSDPDQKFATWAASRRAMKDSGEFSKVRYAWSNEHDLLRVIRHAAGRSKWLPTDTVTVLASSLIPEHIKHLLNGEPIGLVSLDELGWNVGQGLRTGGNDFFYVSKHSLGDGYSSLLLPGEQLYLSDDVLRASVRRQSELPERTRRVIEHPISSVLVLEGWALPKDVRSACGPKQWKKIEGDLARLIHAAASKTYQRGTKVLGLPELSAVRTNVRGGDDDRPARFWYQLPALAMRHTPDIYLARINSGLATPYLNPERLLVVDANFSTLWASSPDALPAPAMLALLSSSWTRAFLEASGTVLGGGALKIEATHLRRLLVPTPDATATQVLSELAANWHPGAAKTDPSARIDEVVASLLECGPAGRTLNEFALERMRRRSS